MILLKETAGDTLTGAVDGSNVHYVCSFDFNADTVNVYVNGRLKIRSWDDGFVVLPPRTIAMKEALLPGDSLEIEYKSDTRTGGGALGGVPGAPETMILEPGVAGESLVPDTTANNLQATATADLEKPSLLATSLRPVIIGSNQPDDCDC